MKILQINSHYDQGGAARIPMYISLTDFRRYMRLLFLAGLLG